MKLESMDSAKMYEVNQLTVTILDNVSFATDSTTENGCVNNIRIVPKWQIVGSQSEKRQPNFSLSPNVPPRKVTLLTEDGPLEVNDLQLMNNDSTYHNIISYFAFQQSLFGF